CRGTSSTCRAWRRSSTRCAGRPSASRWRAWAATTWRRWGCPPRRREPRGPPRPDRYMPAIDGLNSGFAIVDPHAHRWDPLCVALEAADEQGGRYAALTLRRRLRCARRRFRERVFSTLRDSAQPRRAVVTA